MVSSIRRQRGVALITVLLVMAVATVIASQVVSRLNFHIQRTQNQQLQAQAYQYALGGEEFARQLLHEDHEKSSYDHREEPWAKLKPVYTFNQGQLKIQLLDLHSRLNINNLLTDEGTLNEAVYEQFLQLFNALSIDTQLLNTLVDWLDKDVTPRVLNSEDNGYLALDTPYRAANAPLSHLSELLLLQGWQQQQLTQLAPYVTVLPVATHINVNTASATVLATLAKKLTPLQAAAIVPSQQGGGFDSMEAFLTHDSLAGIEVNTSAASVNSEFFMVYVESTFAERTVRLQSLLHRDNANGDIKLVSRDRSSHFLWPSKDNDHETPR